MGRGLRGHTRWVAGIVVLLFLSLLSLSGMRSVLTGTTARTVTAVSQDEHPSSSSQHVHMASMYHPVERRQLLEKRLAYPCDTRLPGKTEKIEELDGDGGARNWTLSRYVMYHNLRLFLKTQVPKLESARAPMQPRVLDAGGSRFLQGFLDKLNVTLTSYPQVDLHAAPFADGAFDMVVLDQVLEHAFFPHLLLLECRRILADGGVLIVTSCAYNPVHESSHFHDLWRFQLDAFKQLSLPFDDILMCGAWGTQFAVGVRNRFGMGSDEETRLFEKHLPEQVRQNDDDNPFSVWMALQK